MRRIVILPSKKTKLEDLLMCLTWLDMFGSYPQHTPLGRRHRLTFSLSPEANLTFDNNHDFCVLHLLLSAILFSTNCSGEESWDFREYHDLVEQFPASGKVISLTRGFISQVSAAFWQLGTGDDSNAHFQ
jgi:hypothetical protein